MVSWCVSLSLMSPRVDSMVEEKFAPTTCNGPNISLQFVNICVITEDWFNEKMCCGV